MTSLPAPTDHSIGDRPLIQRQRLLDRFLSYVRIATPADPGSDTYPSSGCQRDLADVLVAELTAMGLRDAHVDSNSLVWATVPATNGQTGPVVALVAHMDTSPEAPGHGVRPQVIRDYDGGDIALPGGGVIRVDACEALRDMIGATLITTDGTTLLGGDDKAGVAIIMELAATLIENPHIAHGPVRILMTCDEEIGRGTDKIDLGKLDATVAYTIDGGGAGVIDVETFSADAATVRFVGHNIHPAIATGRMINAVRAAGDFVAALPRDTLTPETTRDRQGFIHPHTIRGGVGEATVELILRSFDADDLATYADLIRRTADLVRAATPGLKVEVNVAQQYRNLAEGLKQLPESITLAERAFDRLGRPHTRAVIRGGTDGSQLTAKGLPTPNLSSGQHNIHSTLEFACLDEMIAATEHAIELVRLWGEIKV